MSHTIVIGLQSGDEGKSAIVDRFSKNHNFVARFSGGDNCGHTVVVGDNKYVHHIIPVGILNGVHSHIGRGCVINPDIFVKEFETLSRDGFDTSLITVDENAHLILPAHIQLDKDREQQFKIGTTRRGVGPAYEDKAARRGVRVRNINSSHPENWQTLKSFAVPSNFMNYAEDVLFEGAQSSLLDVDSDYYPFVTSSSCLAGSAGVGIGLSLLNKSVNVVGVIKAYCTKVGTGPYPTCIEQSHPMLANTIRTIGGELGATTGRPRQIGWLDLISVKEQAALNGVTEIAINKSDVLSGLGPIQVRTGGTENTPLYTTLEGWDNVQDIKFRNFINFVEHFIDIPVRYVGTGPERNDYFTRS